MVEGRNETNVVHISKYHTKEKLYDSNETIPLPFSKHYMKILPNLFSSSPTIIKNEEKFRKDMPVLKVTGSEFVRENLTN